MADYGTFASRALDWTDRHLDLFDLFDGDRAFEMKRGQRVGELAILVHVMHDVRGEGTSPRLHRMVTLLERIRDHPEFGDRVMRSPIEFVLFAEVYARLRAVGSENFRMRSLLMRAVSADMLRQTERVPHRLMDIRACLDLAQIECPLPCLESLFERSILATMPSAVWVGEDDLYALTHVLMFLTGFGTRQEQRLSIERRESIGDLLGTLIAIAAMDRHWDLLAEFLICWKGLDLGVHQIVERAWEALEAAQNEDGSIPGPAWIRHHDERDRCTSENSWRELVFSHHYHTTLVSALAGMLWAARPACERQTRDCTVGRPSPVLTTSSSTIAEQLTRAAGSAQSWLEKIGRALICESFPKAQPMSLVVLGLWLSHAIAHGEARSLPSLIREIGIRLIELDKQADPAWSAVAPPLKVIVSTIFASQSVHIPYLHSPGGFLERVQLVLASRASGVQEHGFGQLECLLRAVGLASPAPEPQCLDSASIEGLARSVPSHQGPESMQSLFEELAAAGRWGLGVGHVDRASEWLLELASAWGLYALRRYDLIAGANRLRVVGWCNPGNKATRANLHHGIEFLLQQQRPEGDFGFLGPELRRYREMDPPGPGEIELRLLVTTECMWTLAEAVRPSWRLYSSLPRPSACLQTAF
jgi:hypothetical protein